MTKAGFCAILGRPSSGKSTLLNSVCGHKVSIVADIPQTTRNKVRGVYTTATEDAARQVVFVDTPGFHNSEKKLNRYLRDLVTSTLDEIDSILYLLDVSRPIGAEEEELAGLLAGLELPVIVALNKVDVSAAQPETCESFLDRALPDRRRFRISAARSEGLEPLLAAVVETMPESELYYPPDFYTDQDPEFRVAEVIREQAIARTREEVPHALYVEVADMEIRKSGGGTGKGRPGAKEEPTFWIRAFIVVERESQKGIVVGRGGEQIREIRVAAQRELAELFDYRIYLDLRVKVQQKWRRTDSVLSRLVH